jgi:hypothetical protein
MRQMHWAAKQVGTEKTFEGRKVSSGVYLVFCSNEDGSQTYVTKFLFMN